MVGVVFFLSSSSFFDLDRFDMFSKMISIFSKIICELFPMIDIDTSFYEDTADV